MSANVDKDGRRQVPMQVPIFLYFADILMNIVMQIYNKNVLSIANERDLIVFRSPMA